MPPPRNGAIGRQLGQRRFRRGWPGCEYSLMKAPGHFCLANRRIVRARLKYRRNQREAGLMIPRDTFRRLVREITHIDLCRPELRWDRRSLLCLQEGAETFLVNLFEGKSHLATIVVNHPNSMQRPMRRRPTPIESQ